MMAAIDEHNILSSSSLYALEAATDFRARILTVHRSGYKKASRPLIYVTRRIPQEGMDVLLKTCDVKQWDSENAVSRGELLQGVVGVNGILCMQGDIVDLTVLNSAGPNLQVVATVSHRTGHIAVEECHRRGIEVITCPAQSTEILSELTMVLALLTIKESQTEEESLSHLESQIPDLISTDPNRLNSLAWTYRRACFRRRVSEEQQAFQWNKGKPENTRCSSWRKIVKKTFGVYGMTKLGLQFAKFLKTVGVDDVIIADKNAVLDDFNVNLLESGCEFVSFDEFISKSDVICVCGSTGKQSKELFSMEVFKKMNKHGILIVSQSEESAVNYMDLYMSLRNGHIKAAGLNDCNQRPVPFKNLLQGQKNCVFLPQTQESVFDVRHKLSVLISKNLTEALKSKARIIT